MANRLVIRVIAAVALLAAVSLPAQTPQSAWKSYPYPADGFSISAPSQPSYSNQTKATDAGNVDLHNYIISLGDSAVIISSSEVKGLENAPPKERLQKAKMGALKAGNATLTSEKEITLGSYPGLQYEATGQSQNLHVRARMYIVKNRLFQLLEISPLSTPFPADADRISSSFKLLN